MVFNRDKMPHIHSPGRPRTAAEPYPTEPKSPRRFFCGGGQVGQRESQETRGRPNSTGTSFGSMAAKAKPLARNRSIIPGSA